MAVIIPWFVLTGFSSSKAVSGSEVEESSGNASSPKAVDELALLRVSAESLSAMFSLSSMSTRISEDYKIKFLTTHLLCMCTMLAYVVTRVSEYTVVTTHYACTSFKTHLLSFQCPHQLGFLFLHLVSFFSSSPPSSVCTCSSKQLQAMLTQPLLGTKQ